MLQGVPLPPQFPLPGNSPWVLAQAIALIVATVGGVTGALLLLRAVARRLSHPAAAAAPDASADVAELRDTMQHLTGRVGELEERLDFAERLLARDRDADRLKGPKA